MNNQIILPWIAFSQEGGNARGHWRSHEKARKNAKKIGFDAAKKINFVKRDVTKLHGYKLRIVLIPPMNRYPDWDNAAKGLKYYQDGICEALGIEDNQITEALITRGMPRKKDGQIWWFIT